MYSTTSMGAGAFLIARGYKLKKLEPVNDPRRPSCLAFIFDMDEAEGESLFRQFYAGAMITAQLYEQALVKLKIAISERNGYYTRRPKSQCAVAPVTPNYFREGGAR